MNLMLPLFFLELSLSISHGANILFMVTATSYSHQIYFRPIILELLKRDHNVTYITTIPIEKSNYTNLKQIDISETFDLEMFKTPKSVDLVINERFNDEAYEEFLNTCHIMVKQIFQLKNMKNFVENRKNYEFDVVILEWHREIMPFMQLGMSFGCPLIGVVSLGYAYTIDFQMGNPLPFLMSYDFNFAFSHPMTFWERIELIRYYFKASRIHERYCKYSNEFCQKTFNTSLPDIREISKKVHVILLNQHPVFNGAFPTLPGVDNIGGIFKYNPTPLPKDIKAFMDNAQHGVIYFSLGSNVNSQSISQEKLQIFIDTFLELPYKILWKWDGDDFPVKNDKIFTKKWFPQSDILHHPNVKCFIFQGGMQSLEEAIHAKVPLIGIPFFGDQFYSVNRIHRLKIGVHQRYMELTKPNLKNSIVSIIQNQMYKNNMIKLSNIYQDQMVPPIQKAVWWIEHAIRHGTDYLQNPLLEYSFMELYMLDVIAFVVLGVIFTVLIGFYIIKIIFKHLRNHSKIIRVKHE